MNPKYLLLAIVSSLLVGCQPPVSMRQSPAPIRPATIIPLATSTEASKPLLAVSTMPVMSVDNADQVIGLTEFHGHTDVVVSLAFSPNGKLLASASFDGTIRLWDLATGAEIATLNHWPQATGLAFSPDGSLLASGGTDGSIRLWQVETGVEKAVLEGHKWGVWGVAFSPDGTVLISGGIDNTVRLWDVATGTERTILQDHSNDVYGVVFSPDGTIFASSSKDMSVRLWDLKTGAQTVVREYHSIGVNNVVFSPDGTLLAVGVPDSWDDSAYMPLNALLMQSGPVFGVAFSPNGSLLAVSYVDEKVGLWDVRSATELAALEGAPNMRGAIEFSMDAKLIATGSNEGIIKLWGVY